MFGGLRRSPGSHRDGAAAAGPTTPDGPDLSAIPPFPAEIPGGLAAVDPELIGRYVGLAVAAVTPLSGADSPGTNGDDRGASVVGRAGAREARMRASGMTEEQIAIVRAKIDDAAAQHQQNAWTIHFVIGSRASVQVFPLAAGGEFAAFRSRFERQPSQRRRHRPGDLLDASVHEVAGAHYESYRIGGVLVAKGRGHESTVECSRLEMPGADRTLAALAALGLWAVEG